MMFRERLTAVAKEKLKEGLENSKDIISQNVINSFNDMGMANVTPGEFSDGEITDRENLVNKGDMANDTEFNKKENDSDCLMNKLNNMFDDLLDISAPFDHDEDKAVSIEINKQEADKKESINESQFHKLLTKIHKSSKLYESNYAGPLDYVPDTRINVSDVVTALKNKIGDGSEAIHVDQIYDDKKNNAYKVSQVDKEKLPNKLQVENVLLELDGDTYKVNKVSDSFPLAR